MKIQVAYVYGLFPPWLRKRYDFSRSCDGIASHPEGCCFRNASANCWRAEIIVISELTFPDSNATKTREKH